MDLEACLRSRGDGSGTGLEFVQPAEVRDKAIAAADRALALDPNLPDAHKTRAFVAVDGQWDL